jgi:hypothetical protein
LVEIAKRLWLHVAGRAFRIDGEKAGAAALPFYGAHSYAFRRC